MLSKAKVNRAHLYVNAEVRPSHASFRTVKKKRLKKWLVRNTTCELVWCMYRASKPRPPDSNRCTLSTASLLAYPAHQANVLRRALTPEEHADIRHYEVCWVEAVHGEALTPNVRTRTHAYVAITSRHVHIIDVQGTNPGVRTVPLNEIESVEAQGPVVPGPFSAAAVNRNSERLQLTRRKEFDAAMQDNTLPRQLGQRAEARHFVHDPERYAEGMANRKARATAAVSAGKSMMGRMISKMMALSSSSSSSSSSFNKRRAAAAGVPSPPQTPPPPRRGASFAFKQQLLDEAPGWSAGAIAGPVTEGWSGAGPVTESVMGIMPSHHGLRGPAADVAPHPGQHQAAMGLTTVNRPPPLALETVKEARAVAMDHSLGLNSTQRSFDLSAAVENAREKGSQSARAAVERSGSSSQRDIHIPYLYEHIVFITFEAGSQVLYQLNCAVLRLHMRQAASAAAASSNPNTPRLSLGFVSSLAQYVPPELLWSPGARAAVSSAATRNDITNFSALAVVSGMVDHARATSRHRDGHCTFEPSLLLPPVPPSVSTHLSINQSVMNQLALRPNSADVREEAAAVVERVEEEARLGLQLAAPLVPAIAVATAVLEAVKLDAAAKERGRDTRHDADYARELFGDLELAMLAPINLAEQGCRPLIEDVGALDIRDVCAAAAMAEHFLKVPKMRALALASPELFDVTVSRLTDAVSAATGGHQLLAEARVRARAVAAEVRALNAKAVQEANRARTVSGAKFTSVVSLASAARLRRGDGVSNWARLVSALRQGAAAHRAVQLFVWTRAVLAGSEGAALERADIIRRGDAFEALVHAAFTFAPVQHAALGRSSDHEEDKPRSNGYHAKDVDLTRLRMPENGVSAGVIDLLVDVLYEAIMLAHHAHLLGGDRLTSRYLVAHIVQDAVPARAVRPKVAGMFARLVNLSLKPNGGAITGGDAVRAYRCGFVLRHLIEGMDGDVVVAHVREEYQYEMKFVLSRPGVHDRALDGDVFFEQHARPHYDFVMARCLPWDERRTTAHLWNKLSIVSATGAGPVQPS